MKKAVALKYPENAPAPFITASAKGKLAEEVLKIAKMNDIMIVEDLELSELLSVQDLGTYIPEEAWEALALIFTYLTDFQD